MQHMFRFQYEESVTPEILATFTLVVVNMARGNENFLKPEHTADQFKPSFETTFLHLRGEINSYSNLLNRGVFFNDDTYSMLLKALIDTSQSICITETILYCTLIYIDRLLKRHNKYRFDLSNLALIVFCFIDLTQRMHTDSFWSLSSYQKVTGIPSNLMKKVELQLLNDVEWNLNVQDDEYIYFSEKVLLLSRHIGPGLQNFIPVDVPQVMALSQDPRLSPALITQQVSSPYYMHGQYRDVYTFQ